MEHSSFVPECGGQGIVVKYNASAQSSSSSSGAAGIGGAGSNVKIIGRLYQGIKGEDATNWLIPTEELKKFDLVGKPFYWEHEREIGTINSNWVDDNNWLWIEATIHPPTRIGEKMFNYIRNGLLEGKLKQLSISWLGGADRLGVIKGVKTFKEASLVEKGKYSNTDIFSVKASANQQENVTLLHSELTTTEGEVFQFRVPSEMQQPSGNATIDLNANTNANQPASQTGQPILMQLQQQQQQQAAQQSTTPLMNREKAKETFGVEFTEKELQENRTMDQMYKLAFSKAREENIRLAATQKQLADENAKYQESRTAQIEAYKLQQQPVIEETWKSIADHLPHGIKTTGKQLLSEWGTDPTVTGYLPWTLVKTIGSKLAESAGQLEKFKIDNETLKRQLQDHQTTVAAAVEAASAAKNRQERNATGNVNFQTQPVIDSMNAATAAGTGTGVSATQTMMATNASSHNQRFMPIVAPIPQAFDNVVVERASKTFGKSVTRDILEFGFQEMPGGAKDVIFNEEFVSLFNRCNQLS